MDIVNRRNLIARISSVIQFIRSNPVNNCFYCKGTPHPVSINCYSNRWGELMEMKLKPDAYVRTPVLFNFIPDRIITHEEFGYSMACLQYATWNVMARKATLYFWAFVMDFLGMYTALCRVDLRRSMECLLSTIEMCSTAHHNGGCMITLNATLTTHDPLLLSHLAMTDDTRALLMEAVPYFPYGKETSSYGTYTYMVETICNDLKEDLKTYIKEHGEEQHDADGEICGDAEIEASNENTAISP